jgi:hypothetical protein
MSLDEFGRLDILGVISEFPDPEEAGKCEGEQCGKGDVIEVHGGGKWGHDCLKDILRDREAWFFRLLEDTFDTPEQTLQERLLKQCDVPVSVDVVGTQC